MQINKKIVLKPHLFIWWEGVKNENGEDWWEDENGAKAGEKCKG